MLAGGCSRKATIPFPAPARGGDPVTVTFDGNVSKQRRHLIEITHEWIGTPYKYAGAEKGVGTDCSGMVLRVYEEAASLKLPRNSAKQAEFCDRIDLDDVIPGDLVFFATNKNNDDISHVGIMLNHESFIHASASKGVVISTLSNPYYARSLRKFGRIPHFE